MVNLDKWEEIEFKDIRAGDKIKRINNHLDGTTAVVTGVAHHQSASFEDAWISKGKFILAKAWYDFPTDLYRRKPKPFEFPTTEGSIIAGMRKASRGRFEFILSEGKWFKINPLREAPYTEEQVRCYFEDFEVVFDRASVNVS